MKLDRVESKSLRAMIYEQLRDKIMTGEIKPGEELSLRMLAKQLGVSMMPVREAIWQLESDKILVVRNNRGIKVNTLSSGEMKEALHLRCLLETEAVTLSCNRRKSDDILIELHMLKEQMEKDGCNPRTFLELNHKFHSLLYSCAESSLLLDLIEKLWARTIPYMFLHVTSKENLIISPANSLHNQIYEHFCNRDVKKLVKALVEDITNPADYLISKMDDEPST